MDELSLSLSSLSPTEGTKTFRARRIIGPGDVWIRKNGKNQKEIYHQFNFVSSGPEVSFGWLVLGNSAVEALNEKR